MLLSMDDSAMINRLRRIEAPNSGLWKQAQWSRIALDLVHILFTLFALKRGVRGTITQIRKSVSGNRNSDFYDLVLFCDSISNELGSLLYSKYKSILETANAGLVVSEKLRLRFADIMSKYPKTPMLIRFLERKAHESSRILEYNFDELQLVAESLVAALEEKISTPAA